MKPIISVIMGTYNPDATQLEKAIESIINQTFEQWELLLVDDGSSDTVFSKIKKLENKDRRIRMIHNSDNRGLAFALNEAMKYAKGKYIARMDDDDISLPERFEQQIEFLNQNPEYSWVGCDADLFDEEGVWGRAERPEKPVKKSFLHYSPFIHPSVMFRREVLIEFGGYTESLYTSRCEDYELFMRLYANGKNGYNIKRVLFQYQEDSRLLRRSMKYCYYEMVIRLKGFSEMGILSLSTVPYIFKPVLVGLISLCPSLAHWLRTTRRTGDYRIETQKQRDEKKKYIY